MRKWLLALLLVSTGAHAEETRLLCTTEEAMNSIGQKLVVSRQAADEAATPYLNQGICLSLPWDMHVDITYHGRTYGDQELLVQVIGFMDSNNNHMFYGLMPLKATTA
jgi:hypothetical protein